MTATKNLNSHIFHYHENVDGQKQLIVDLLI
jgi:hypothetical protein